MNKIKKGAWVTMITPYTPDGKIDYAACGRLVEWSIESGLAGIFAVCQSSEMFFLTREERLALARFVIQKAAGRISVVVSGHVSDTVEEQTEELCQMAELGPDAVVLISNRLVAGGEKNFISNCETIVRAMPKHMPLGMYECPFPEKRLLKHDEISYLNSTGRFLFVKDTCCDIDEMRARAKLISNDFMFFNANSATLYESLKAGFAGYCGVMANFHPRLYAWLCGHIQEEKAQFISRVLGVMSVIEARDYPVCAKRYLKNQLGFPVTELSRSKRANFVPAIDQELEGIKTLTDYAESLIK